MGTVYLGLYGERKIAIKEFDVTNDSELKRIALEEAAIQISFKHPNIINYYGYFESRLTYEGLFYENVTLISDYYSKGTLFVCINKNEDPPAFNIRLKWALQIAYALEYLYSQNITHRDLKPENILISENNDAVIADFGYAKRLVSNLTRKNYKSNVGTILWMAPEIFEGAYYDSSVDIYAYGILLYEILSLQRPYTAEDYSNEEIFKKKIIGVKSFKNGKEEVVELRPDIRKVTDLDEKYSILMKKCWNRNPSSRPSWKEIIHTLSN
jgi:serine/threonine protein kinase